jgi:flagellar motor protein MotB
MPVQPGERFQNNSELAVARARRVAVLLHHAGRIPLSRFAVSVNDDTAMQAPEHLRSALQERTAVLRLTMLGQ